MNTQPHRRHFLRMVGGTIAVPFLESLTRTASAATAPPVTPPRRLAFFYIPNGAHLPDWRPAELGPLAELPASFAELAELRDDLLFLSGLELRGAEPQGDGPGDHARSMAAFLTGAHPKKTDGRDIRNGISVDQFAAMHCGQRNRYPSLELGLEAGAIVGRCDSGYSCAYSSNLSWRTESTPVPKDVNPQSVFDRLFGNGERSDGVRQRQLRAERRSVLDFAREEANSLRRRLQGTDRQKLDEYLYAIRDVERRVAASAVPDGSALSAPLARPDGVPEDYGDYARLMLDLLVLAFQMDCTRVATFVFGNEGSQRSYREIGISEGHHELSHHDGQTDKLRKIAQINRYHASLLGHFLRRLKGTSEGDGNLLSHSLIVYGSGIQDGNRHNHRDLPIVVAGQGDGGLSTGRHLEFPAGTPLTNLYVSLLDRMGVPVDSFGDSTGRLEW